MCYIQSHYHHIVLCCKMLCYLILYSNRTILNDISCYVILYYTVLRLLMAGEQSSNKRWLPTASFYRLQGWNPCRSTKRCPAVANTAPRAHSRLVSCLGQVCQDTHTARFYAQPTTRPAKHKPKPEVKAPPLRLQLSPCSPGPCPQDVLNWAHWLGHKEGPGALPRS